MAYIVISNSQIDVVANNGAKIGVLYQITWINYSFLASVNRGKENICGGQTRQEKHKTKTCDHMQTGVLSNDFIFLSKVFLFSNIFSVNSLCV